MGHHLVGVEPIACEVLIDADVEDGDRVFGAARVDRDADRPGAVLSLLHRKQRLHFAKASGVDPEKATLAANHGLAKPFDRGDDAGDARQDVG